MSRKFRKGPRGGKAQPITPSVAARQGVGVQGNGGPNKYNEMAGKPGPTRIADVSPDNNFFSPFQPIEPFGPPNILYPRTFDYPAGFNLNFIPARVAMFEQLRAMSRSWGLLRAVIETRKDQLLRVPWAFQRRDAPKKKDKRIDELHDFFIKPDGKTRFGGWLRKYLDDVLVLDAGAIYKYKGMTGKPIALDVLDGATIKPLIDDAGRRPDAPSPAFQQIIKGMPLVNFDETELIYTPMRPTTQYPVYGYSPVEQIFLEVIMGIRRLTYQVAFWTEGSMPELIITVPESWSAQQLGSFQAHFDALLAGNTEYKSKVRFVPGGMKPFDIKNANGAALKSEFDEWLATLVCFVFGISPSTFKKQVNRATAQNAAEMAEEEGLFPFMFYLKQEVFDPIVQEDFGYTDLEFNWLPRPEPDAKKQMEVLTGNVKAGLITINEARGQMGLDDMDGGDELIVESPQGPMPLKETIEANRAMANDKPNDLMRTQQAHAKQMKTPATKPAAKLASVIMQLAGAD